MEDAQRRLPYFIEDVYNSETAARLLGYRSPGGIRGDACIRNTQPPLSDSNLSVQTQGAVHLHLKPNNERMGKLRQWHRIHQWWKRWDRHRMVAKFGTQAMIHLMP